jgi:hypothetical protein
VTLSSSGLLALAKDSVVGEQGHRPREEGHEQNARNRPGTATMIRVALFCIVMATALAACSTSALEGNGDVVTESRTVSEFDAVEATDGIEVILALDPTATGDVVLAVTTDSNLQEFLTTDVADNTLSTSPDRDGGVTSTSGLEVSGTVAVIRAVSVDNGAQVAVAGSVDDVTVTANNGSRFDGGAFEVVAVTVEADNAGDVTVCATGTVSGTVNNGAQLTVLCGGTTDGVETSNGGQVSTTP